MELQADGSKSQSVDTAGKIWKFRWIIKNFSSTTDEKLYSEDFTAEGNKWRILICPKGNKGDHLSICLGVGVADSATLPSGWRRFGVALIDQNDRKTSITKVATCVFNAKEVDWGFTSFLSLTELHNPLKGYLVNDACLVEAYVSTDTTTGLISHELIVSHELVVETGSAIGNQKTTITRPVEITAPSPSRPSCQIVDIEPEEPTKEDMNTFFTSLESELLSSNTVFSQEEAKEALAKLEAALNMTPINFHNSGEFSPLKLAFKILASVGCSSINLTIEQKTKLLAMEESLKQLADRAAKAVEDKNRLTAKESMKKTVACNLECSLTRYKEVESKVKQVEKKLTALQEQVDEAQKERESMLAEQKGIFRSSKNMKMELEALTKECEAKAKVAEDEEKIVEVEWGRMKHFISSVKEDIKRELEEQYGGEEEIRLKKQQEEKEQKRKEKAEAHLYTVIKVARNEDLVEQIGKYIYFDLVDHEKVRSFRIQKQMPFKVFKEEVAKEFGIPVQYQRFWLWAKRQNHTYRPHLPLTQQEEAQSVSGRCRPSGPPTSSALLTVVCPVLVGQLREVSSISNAELKLFLEVELGRHLRPVDPPEKTTQDILLFFKLYDPYKEELRYIGRMFVMVDGKPTEILARINKMAGFDPDEEIELYEEIRFEPDVMCDHIDKTLTFRTSKLENGDIICLQKISEVLRVECRYPDVPSFLEYVHSRQSEAKARVAEVKTDKLDGEE
ncbi:hypothetical protein V6N13_091753 [Hibiscus sabdariffa]|uniref:MATH domain-containing protein n=1 Tax=Hibiscus sabdariffa TaxID=183260 RepID=A0ABR2QEU6_9ROSI